jgi:hypothetical protein
MRSIDGLERLGRRFVDFESRVADVTEPPLRIFVQPPPQQLSIQSARAPATRTTLARVQESPQSSRRAYRRGRRRRSHVNS